MISITQHCCQTAKSYGLITEYPFSGNFLSMATLQFHQLVVFKKCYFSYFSAETVAMNINLVTFKKYKTFSVLIYSYINTSGNWKNEKLCGNTTPAGRSVFIQFRVFPISTSVDITVYQYG